jgi:hypothetical protein
MYTRSTFMYCDWKVCNTKVEEDMQTKDSFYIH